MRIEVRDTSTGRLIGMMRYTAWPGRSVTMDMIEPLRTPLRPDVPFDAADEFSMPITSVRLERGDTVLVRDGQKFTIPTLWVNPSQRKHLTKVKGFRRS